MIGKTLAHYQIARKLGSGVRGQSADTDAVIADALRAAAEG